MTNDTLDIQSAAPEQQPSSKKGLKACAWAGAVCAFAAWVALIFNGNVSFILALGGVIISSFGARCPKGLVKDMAITAIVACAVLLLVFAIFFGVIYYLDKTLG